MPLNELRLFVSSTFRDLQPEREQLVKKVFPRIRKECRERGVEFTEIDLRWGITEEESRTGRTVRICLEEIDKCRPYFIGIIGSRYGWVPGISEIEKDPDILKEFPWLREFAANEKSIIEMEFAHGALLKKNDSSFFYEQTSDIPGTGRTNAISPHASPNELSVGVNGINPLDNLKQTLQSTGVPYRTFTDPEELGEQVFQDILTILDRDFPQKRQLSPLEHERIEHEAYSQNRRQSYIANPAYYEEFLKHVESDGPPLIIRGRSGLGKSALMAYLAHEYQMLNSNAFVVQHFIGAAEGSDPEDVMRQVIMEIKERYHLSDAIPTDDNTLREEFPIWLAKVKPDDKLLLFIDALNQLTGIAPEMHWLPQFIPANVRLIVSTTDDSLPLKQLRERNWNELELQPLTEAQREAIASDFLKRYRKSLPSEDLHTLSADPKSSSPLFLRTVLEELRIFGRHTTLREELEDYLASADERELFQKVLARMERDHGKDAVRNVMTAIWASRHGLSESELMSVTGYPRMALSELMIAMEYHLMTREGFHTFFHNYLREAIQLRYLPTEADQKAAHSRLGTYFSTQEYNSRRRDEEPWQWHEAGDTGALWNCFADPNLFELFANEDHRYHFIAYLQLLEREQNIALFDALQKAMQHDASFERRRWLAQIAREGAFYDTAADILSGLSNDVKENPPDDNTAIDIKRELVQLYGEKQQFKLALPLSEEIVSLLEKNDGESEDLFASLVDLSTIMHGIGDYAGAERVIRRALEFSNAVAPTKHIVAMGNLAALVSAQGNQEEAVKIFQEAHDLSAELLGKMHPSTLHLSYNLGTVMDFAGKPEEALEILEPTLIAIRSSLGDKHLWYLNCLSCISGPLMDLGYYDRAERAIREQIEKSILSLGPRAENTLRAQITLGYLYYIKGNLQEASRIYQTYLPIQIANLGDDHPSVLPGKRTLEKISAALNSKL